MVRLEVTLSSIANEAAELIRAFFPRETVDISENGESEEYSFRVCALWDGKCWKTKLTKDENVIEEEREVYPQTEEENEILYKRRVKGALKETVYYCLKRLEGRGLPYGMLTGVRPLTLSNRLLCEYSPEDTVSHLISEYDVSDEKARLLTETSLVQERVKPTDEDISLYVHIPFCTTRCSYCSFPSELVNKVEPYMDKYLDALEKELSFITDNAKGNFESLYVGGGTPTSLSHRHFERLCGILSDAAKKRGINEFTVEAGRPDTVDEGKLRMMKSANVTRISINPQTMNDKTLEKIGRKHTSEDIVNTFILARELGFDDINMDLILGLQDEDADDIRNTFEKVIKLMPDEITVHVLALKHASNLNRDGVDIFGSKADFEGVMREYSEKLSMLGYEPYYLYRQKYMLGGLENLGRCRDNKICRYNIRMMDDKCTCYAAGAGSISKRFYSGTTAIERQANPKNALDYIARLDECIEKKRILME